MRALIGATLAAALAACSGGETPVPAAAQPALASVVVQSETVPEEVVLDGVLEALNQATVSAQTSGRVIELPYDVGDYVPKGAVIARFRATEQEARLTSANAGVREAQARRDEAEATFRRTRDMFARGLVAKAALDNADAALRSAKARVDAAAAAAKEAQEQSEHTVVRAPYAGIVVKRHIEVGETATVGRPLMTGLSLEHLRAIVQIPQQAIGPLRANKQARVILPDGRSVDATQVRIPPSADPATHTYDVLVTLPEGDHGGYPGMLVKVAFVSGQKQELRVPAAAVVHRSEVTGVYVLGDGGRIEFRYVRPGTTAPDGRVPMLAGIAAGERVALDPVAAVTALKRGAPAS